MKKKKIKVKFNFKKRRKLNNHELFVLDFNKNTLTHTDIQTHTNAYKHVEIVCFECIIHATQTLH